MRVVAKWSIKKTASMICDALLNKFDFFLVIEGKRGLGKSTLAHHLARRVAVEMRRREIESHKFSPRKCLLYKREEVIDFFNQWNKTGIADEMINVTFNRDFYNSDQKDLIKMINMNRDHCNFFIACVPSFQSLDNQIKNLCKMRITVRRRGIGVVQLPNKVIYGRDIWDTAYNEKVERSWLKKGKPKYSKLSTYKGMIWFSALNKTAEEVYIKIKRDKRNEIYEERQGKGEGKEEGKPKDIVDLLVQRVKEGKLRNIETVKKFCLIEGLSFNSVINKFTRRVQGLDYATPNDFIKAVAPPP